MDTELAAVIYGIYIPYTKYDIIVYHIGIWYIKKSNKRAEYSAFINPALSF